ncbi:Fidgetin-like protein 1 [Wickerhamomyces ciferrii]|uniref:Fidgetin-like protein 1 n=1 Tax=Wickerhamomyces ciferrii (strain ATCC 14091 / BCRC 22168 / CBS 111 / JCM 3599 / NBRC 0793 / NRRL Y-1031 F-60-10) TaxID=1206466 RepID=K0KSQ7_WICCF|nr:Fidgetin-like protein 1 [Wickerhamomyces ciferrii]CCH44394.1 Fidgetin-like protein 1 [Wickerhamomyces ciferrii]
MATASFNYRITTLYETAVQRQKEQCIMEEIKNNNQQALLNYENLVSFINDNVNSLKTQYDVKRLSAVDKVALNNVLQLKSSIITRKSTVEKRLNHNENYKISDMNRDNISSYSSFFSAFKKPFRQQQQQKTPQQPTNEFKIPSNPQQINSNGTSTPKINNGNSDSTTTTRRSLDIQRTRKPSGEFARKARSKSPSSRRDRPKSIDLTINQAALLAWDAKQQQQQNGQNGHYKSSGTTSPRASSPPPRSSSQTRIHKSNQSSQALPKRKYDYVQPSINTQINLTPLGQKPRSPSTGVQRKPSPKSQSQLKDDSTKEKPILESANDSKGLGIQETNNDNNKSYSDPRIKQVMKSLQGVDKQACEQILDEILITDEKLTWDDLAGLSIAKKSLKETVVYPFLRPDLFKGLREPISGMLLFGPPGTGKTMIAKTVANESNSTFFSVSASSLLSKYLGESEKLIRALFYLAKKLSPSIIFFDEIDSLLTARSDNENESSRRVKTEFLIQWSSLSSATANSTQENRVLVLAATNLPWAIDEAARRRFTRRLYIPLPEFETRLTQLHKLFKFANHSLNEVDFIMIANLTEGYSNSDLTSLAKEAAMEPIRDCGDNLMNINYDQIRGVELKDFETAMISIKKSVGKETLKRFDDWAANFGSMGA